MFEFPVGELLQRGPFGGFGYSCSRQVPTRLDYLKLLVATMVATPEEQAEYAALARPEVEQHWQRILGMVEKRRLERLEQLAKDVAELERDQRLLRQVGAFDFVAKLDAVLDRMRDMQAAGLHDGGYYGNGYGDVMSAAGFRGFPVGAGSDLIYDLKYNIEPKRHLADLNAVASRRPNKPNQKNV